MTPRSDERRLAVVAIAVLLVLAAAIRMPFWLATTHIDGDPLLWQVWSRAIHQHGFVNIFSSTDTNYTGYHYVLWPISAAYARISPDYELGTASLRVRRCLLQVILVVEHLLNHLFLEAHRVTNPGNLPLRIDEERRRDAALLRRFHPGFGHLPFLAAFLIVQRHAVSHLVAHFLSCQPNINIWQLYLCLGCLQLFQPSLQTDS